MATNDSGLRDDVRAELNGVQASPGRVPDRPRDGAGRPAWVAYVVALGASADVAEDTRHFDAEVGDYVTFPGLTRPELIELADRLAP
jgi:hypothetical protein